VSELFSIGIDIGNQLVVDVELQVIAIRANDGLGEADRGIAARPVERRL